MEQIIIIHQNGDTLPLFSKARVSSVSKATQKVALLSDDLVSISITTATPLDLRIGDYILVYGKRYTLNQLLNITKNGERSYIYDIEMEGAQYDLIDIAYQLPADAYGDTYYANLAGHLNVLMFNINRVLPGKWRLGSVPKDTAYKNIIATEKNCLAALQEFCSEYGVEFEITSDGKTNTLNIKPQAGTTHPFTLKYGRGRGLYTLSRENVSNASIKTRLFVYGGTDNLGNSYGNNKLCLPGTTRLTSYLEDAEAIAKYGIKEGEKNYPDIKPEREGIITAVGSDIISFSDSSMDFDLNEKKEDGSTKYLINDTAAKIKFQTGQLAGYEFDVHKYDHKTKTFIINKFTDENGKVFPSEDSAAFRFAKGDKYIILDINLPKSYIDDAEKRALEAGTKDFATLKQPQVSYKLSIDGNFIGKMYGYETEIELFHVGNFIQIEDTEIGVKKAVRITRIERDLLEKHSYDITLSDTVTKSTSVRVINDIKDINDVITINKLADPAKARRRWKATQELLSMIFDSEGDYYSEKIKPLSIETSMLSVGAKSTQFTLSNVLFHPNYNGNANALYVSSGGSLVHYAIEDQLRTWVMEGNTFSNLTSGTAYYIYARCPIAIGIAGNFVLSAQAKTVSSEAGYYNFLVGVLNSVVTDSDGTRPGRLVSLTYGSSTINGRFIRTGRIESSGGGNCYFDLDNDEIGGVIKFVSKDGSMKDITDVEAKADETKNYINNTLPGILNEIQGQIDGKIESWFQTSDPATSWTTTALKKAHVGDMWYNSTTKLLKRYTVSGSTYSWTTIEDQKAIDAYEAASKAQDTADGKRRVFVVTPYPPYDVGDLWLTGGSTDGQLKRCITARASGSYVVNDWVIAVYYDNTKTTIDGGIVTSGTVQLAGDDQSIKAGVTGEGTEDSSVRFWAGASRENRATAPYRVLQDGTFYATKANIKGHIEAESGTFKGRVEATDGVFYGSLATPPQAIPDNTTALTLSFENGFNYAGTLSQANKGKKIYLPTDKKYNGVHCSIINYGLSSNGYFQVQTLNNYPLLYCGRQSNRNTVNSVILYGTSEVRLKAIEAFGVIRWFVENAMDFSFDYINSYLTNGIPSQIARCLGSYWMASQNSLTVKACNDGNQVKFSSYNADGRFSFVFTKSRATNKDYTIIVRNESGNNCPYRITNKTNTGFTIEFHFQYAMGIEGIATVYVNSGNWGFDIFEFDV